MDCWSYTINHIPPFIFKDTGVISNPYTLDRDPCLIIFLVGLITCTDCYFYSLKRLCYLGAYAPWTRWSERVSLWDLALDDDRTDRLWYVCESWYICVKGVCKAHSLTLPVSVHLCIGFFSHLWWPFKKEFHSIRSLLHFVQILVLFIYWQCKYSLLVS